jgi:hypothetical protein
LIDDLVGENIVALQLIVSPNPRLAAHAHTEECFERRMKPRDPSLLFRSEGFVIYVGIADEEILFKTHRSPLVGCSRS